MAFIAAALIGYAIGDAEISGWVATWNVFSSVAVIPFWIARLSILIISPTESPPEICAPKMIPEHLENISLMLVFCIPGSDPG